MIEILPGSPVKDHSSGASQAKGRPGPAGYSSSCLGRSKPMNFSRKQAILSVLVNPGGAFRAAFRIRKVLSDVNPVGFFRIRQVRSCGTFARMMGWGLASDTLLGYR